MARVQLAEKEKTYDEAADRREAEGAARLVSRRRLDPARLQDRRVADDADAGQCDRLLPRRRITIPICRSRGAAITVKLSTHSAGGITDKDFELARRIDEVVLWRPVGRGARRDAEQVRAERRSALRPRLCSMAGLNPNRAARFPATRTDRRVLFVTGKLAEPALRRVLAEMAPPFACDVAVLKITVAALMTTDWIARALTVPRGVDLVLIPGLCEGDPGDRRTRSACRREGAEGPARDSALLRPCRRRARLRRLGHRDPRRDQQRAAADATTSRREAERFRASGADIIDIGCTPGLPFPGARRRRSRARGAPGCASASTRSTRRDPHRGAPPAPSSC